MQDFLSQPGIELREFLSNDKNNIFPNATTYPLFFSQNLLSPHRVIKHFADDPHSNIRVFYYHLLKLSYEIINEEGEVARLPLQNFKRKVFEDDFEIRFSRQTQQQRVLFNDFQFKKLLAEFLTLMDSQAQSNVEAMVNNYPIMDIILIHVFRSLMCTVGIDEDFDTRIDTQAVFGSLCSILGMGLGNYNSCWKFEDSDMFCLDQVGEDLYFVYCLDEPDSKETQAHPLLGTRNEQHHLVQSKSHSKQPSNLGQTFGKGQSTSDAGDKENLFKSNLSSAVVPVMLSENSSALQKVSSEIKNDLVKLKMSAQKLLSNSGIKSDHQENNRAPLLSLSAVSQTTSFRIQDLEAKKSSFALKAMPTRDLYHLQRQRLDGLQTDSCNPNSISGNYSHQQHQVPEEQIISKLHYEPYKPPSQPWYNPSKDFLLSLNARTDKLSYGYQPEYQSKKYPNRASNLDKSISLSDYYKDFTNSFLLPLLKEPYQSNLRGMKSRIKGTRREKILQTPF